MTDSVIENGYKIYEQVAGESSRDLRANLSAMGPNLEKLCYGYGYSLLLGDDTLSLQLREKVTLVAITMIGAMRGPLKFHINGNLNVGVSPEDIIATIWSIDSYAPVKNIQFAFEIMAEVFADRGIELGELDGEINPNLDSQYLSSIDKKWKSGFLKVLFEGEELSSYDQSLNVLTALAFHRVGSDAFRDQLALALENNISKAELSALFEHAALYYGAPLGITALVELKSFLEIKEVA